MKLRIGGVVVGFLLLVLSLAAQTSSSSSASAQVPPLIQFSNVASDVNGKPLTGVVGITFYLYKDQQGGSPLWLETQNIQPDNTGHYTVLLGSTTSQGLPASIFVSGEAHWLGMQLQGQEEQPRVLLVSTPYALKAGDAETIGGLPSSAFVLANSVHAARAKSPATETQNYIPFFIDSSGDLGNSILFEAGGNAIGIGTTTPSAALEVNGTAKFDGLATFNSAQTFPNTVASITGTSSISITGTKANPIIGINTTFANKYYPQLAAANTFTKSQTITGNLTLSGSGNGLIFPDGSKQTTAGGGTITGVNTAVGSGLMGGGTTGTLNLALINTCAANQVLQWTGSAWACATIGGGGTITGVTAGTDLTGGGTSGTVTLNLDTTKVPQLNTANTFTGNQSITGNLSATGSVSGAAATFTGLVTEAGALLPATGTATASQGFNSQPFDSVTSVFNSTGGAAQNQDFRWLVEPVGNDTSSPSGKLDLLFGANGAAPAETGLSVASNGQITFANGQTFPGGGGTVTSVGSGLGLKGGPITTSGTLTIDTTVVPQLGAANTFTGNQTVTGTLTANSSNAAISGSTSGPQYSGVYGTNTATTGAATGVSGTTNSSSGYGVDGQGPGIAILGESSATAGGAGVFGAITSTTGYGVNGSNSAITGSGVGVYGFAASPTGYGVQGFNEAATGNAVGVYGTTQSTTGYGVEGTSLNVGVYGTSASPGGYGMEGVNQATTGTAVGVYGSTNSPAGYGSPHAIAVRGTGN